MTPDAFLKVVKDQRALCDTVLANRKAMYSGAGDRLYNFKQAAALTGVLPEQALGGMLAKQIVALFGYLHDLDKGKNATEEAWLEKITDSINYLHLLRALLEDTERLK